MINKKNIVSIEKKYNSHGNFVSYKTIYNINKVCFVPLDEANRHYQAIQEWIAEGNTVIDNGGNS
jgi:hypothetical protein